MTNINITKEMLASKIDQCSSKFKEYEAKITFKLRRHDTPTDMATTYRQMKGDLYSLKKDVEVANIILIDSDAIKQYVDKKVESLYFRAVDMLASFEIELNKK